MGFLPAVCVCLSLCLCVYLCVCLCVCLGWRFAGQGRQLSQGSYLLHVCLSVCLCVRVSLCAVCVYLCVCVWGGGLPDKVDNYHRCRTCCMCVCLSLCPCVYLCGLCLSMCLSVCVCVWDGGLPDKVDNYHRGRTCCMCVCLSLCPCVYLCSLCLSACLCVCVCLGWRFAGRGRQLSRVVPAGAAADGPVGPQVDNVRLHDVCLQSRQRARRSHLLSTQNSRSVEFTHLTLALTHTLALYHHHHYHHFMCPIIQQCAHLHQCSLEEQDSKVRQEH